MSPALQADSFTGEQMGKPTKAMSVEFWKVTKITYLMEVSKKSEKANGDLCRLLVSKHFFEFICTPEYTNIL